MAPATVVPYLLVPLVLWRVYSRVKRLTARQQSRPWRHRLAALLFPLLLVLLALGSLAYPLSLAALAGGAAAGVALGVVGLRTTRFEQEGDLLYFTPNAHIGVLVSLLLVGRLAFRAIDAYVHGVHAQNVSQSPLTLLVFGIMAGYYACYASGLLRWRRLNLFR